MNASRRIPRHSSEAALIQRAHSRPRPGRDRDRNSSTHHKADNEDVFAVALLHISTTIRLGLTGREATSRSLGSLPV